MAVEQGFRAVIVDDWPMLRAGLAKVLTDAGGRVVVETGDTGLALSAIRAHAPALMIVGDHAGPAAELVSRALALAPDLLCVALVGSAVPDDLRPLLAAGIAAAVPRTVDPEELTEVVSRVMGGERTVSPGLLARMFEGSEGHRDAPDAVGEEAQGPGLTAKEREVLRLLAAGRSNAEIAAVLYVSGATVKTHLAHLYEKLGVGNRHEALTRAVALGLLG
jgi:DNA-binding NarL/FixJ family response regulator